MSAPSPCPRPALRWFGGKWRLAPWILDHIPAHRTYVEPYGGGASVLLRKRRSYAEVYNDLDVDAVNLFRVLRNDAQAARLIDQLRLTPFSRDEFKESYEPTDDPVEKARKLIVMSFQGFGSNAHAKRSTGFRSNSSRSGTTPAYDWAHYPDALAIIVARLQGVNVENRPALEVMAQHDGKNSAHYIDPPYVHATRARFDLQRAYRHEMTDEDHRELLNFVCDLKGSVTISGYPHDLYDAKLKGWRRVEKATHADGARARTEVLWLNPRCASLLASPPLFGSAA